MQKARYLLSAVVDALSRPHKQAILLLVDVTVTPLALFLTCLLATNSWFPATTLARTLPLFMGMPVLAALLSQFLGMAQIRLKAYEQLAVIKTGAFAALLAIGLVALSRGLDVYVSAAGFILFGLTFFLLSVAARVLLLGAYLWALRLGQPRCRVLIYGAGQTGIQLQAALKSHESIVAVAFIDDNKATQATTVAGLRVIPSDRIAEFARDRNIDRVILAMPSVSSPKLAQISRRLEALGLDVFAVPSFGQLIGTEAWVDTLSPLMAGQFLGRQPAEAALPDGALAYAGRSILVSGAGGSIGSELCRQLLPFAPRRIVLFEVSEIALYTIERELRDLAAGSAVDVVAVLGSVTDSRMARKVMADHGVEVVIHTAAYKHVPMVEANPIAGLANNVLGTRTLADAAEQAGVARFILISTDKAVRPTSIMGASKRLAELVVQDLAKRSRGTVFSMVRFGNVLGSSGSVIPLFSDQIARGGPVTLTHPDVTRYFMTLTEAVRLVLLAGSFAHPGKSRGGDVFVLNMGTPIRIRDLAQQMIEAAGYTLREAATPDGDIDIRVIGLRPGEKLHEELLIGEGLLTTPHAKILRAQEASLSELDMAKALQDLGRAVASGDSTAAIAVVRAYVEGYVDVTDSATADAAPLRRAAR